MPWIAAEFADLSSHVYVLSHGRSGVAGLIGDQCEARSQGPSTGHQRVLTMATDTRAMLASWAVARRPPGWFARAPRRLNPLQVGDDRPLLVTSPAVPVDARGAQTRR